MSFNSLSYLYSVFIHAIKVRELQRVDKLKFLHPYPRGSPKANMNRCKRHSKPFLQLQGKPKILKPNNWVNVRRRNRKAQWGFQYKTPQIYILLKATVGETAKILFPLLGSHLNWSTVFLMWWVGGNGCGNTQDNIKTDTPKNKLSFCPH